MLITVIDLEREPLDFRLTLESGAIDYGGSIRQVGGMSVEGRADLIEEHRGSHQIVHDIRIRAGYKGLFEMPCARCLKPVEHALEEQMDLIYRPLGADAGPPERAISTADAEIGYYQEAGLQLEDALREQVLLSLPPRMLCREDCKGLCPGCGRDLNAEACICKTVPSEQRWRALADFRSRLKT